MERTASENQFTYGKVKAVNVSGIYNVLVEYILMRYFRNSEVSLLMNLKSPSLIYIKAMICRKMDYYIQREYSLYPKSSVRFHCDTIGC